MDADLRNRRSSLGQAWERWLEGAPPAGVRDEIVASWGRSRGRLGDPPQVAPLDPEDEVADAWAASPLREAVARVAEDITATAEACDYVAALTDASGRILWTAGSRNMRERAEAVNFVPGGRWDEASVGTNALALALRTGGTEQVFSAEHFSPAVHGWVCYASAVRHPVTGEVLGVLDLSTTWERSHPMALAAAAAFSRAMAAALASAAVPVAPRFGDPIDADAWAGGAGLTAPGGVGLAGSPEAADARRTGRRSRGPRPPAATLTPVAPLRLAVLGHPALSEGGVALMVTLRQAEILLALAVHPGGLTLDELHAYVYGDLPVSTVTLKAEVSRLRRVLGARLASRPYRLIGPVETDALDVLAAVRAGDADRAATLFTAGVLPRSEAPVAADLRVRLLVGVRSLVLASPDPGPAVTMAERFPDDTEVVEHALARLPLGSPYRAVLTSLLAAAEADLF